MEVASIRQVLCTPNRNKSLYLGSTKGNIGHCEAASGVGSLIKTVLMLQKGIIPPLASHTSINPKIPALETDDIVIPKLAMPWSRDFRAALVNNYGAAGSNSAVVVCQPPKNASIMKKTSVTRYPVFISAASEASLVAYCQALRAYNAKTALNNPSKDILADITYNLSQKQNLAHDHTFITAVDSLYDLNEKLAVAKYSSSSRPKPIVLVFGGQTSDHVGLSKDVYYASALLRSHIEHCNSIIRGAGLREIVPAIFDSSPIDDIILLHCMQFAIQYACAKSWMDSGAKIDAVVGHSFGQLTALCISGSLNLSDAIELVSGRARLMQQCWGPERGSMISLEADTETTSKIISMLSTSKSGFDAEIACYNGPTSHVLVGSSESITRVEQILKEEQATLGVVRHRRLGVTHGFHSKFTEPLLPGLKKLASKLTFSKPELPLETCSSIARWTEISTDSIWEHTRNPVYFQEAVERISSRLGACTWLEAGTNSSVAGMVRRALGTTSHIGHIYQPMNLSGSDALNRLVDSTVNLWMAGHRIQFWLFHRLQRDHYTSMNLPPYQFEKSRHWLTWKDNVQEVVPPVSGPEPGKLELLGLISKDSNRAEFTVNPKSEQYQLFVKGHAVLDSPLCPADLYYEIVTKAALELVLDPSNKAEYLPSIGTLSISAPLGINQDQSIRLSMVRSKGEEKGWDFSFVSRNSNHPEKQTTHAIGKVILADSNDKVLTSKLTRYEKLVGPKRADDLLADPNAEGMHGSLVYKVFSKVVNYSDFYQGIKHVSAKGSTYAAQIEMPAVVDDALSATLVDPAALDNFVQVAGMKVNCLEENHPNQVSVCGSIDRIQPTRAFFKSQARENKLWTVWGQSTAEGDKDSLSDIFVFDENKELAIMFLGVRFTRVAIASLTRVLNRANASEATAYPLKPDPPEMTGQTTRQRQQQKVSLPRFERTREQSASGHKSNVGTSSDVHSTLRSLFNKVADVPPDMIKDESTLEDLGIDSLMNTEVLGELRKAFSMEIPLQDFQTLQQFGSLAKYIVSRSSSAQPSSAITPVSSEASSVDDVEESTLTSMSEPLEPSKDDLVPRLARLISEQLETNVAMLSDTCLGDHGLDSLLSVEVTSDIEKAFNVKLELGSLTGETTFGELVKLVLKQTNGTFQIRDVSCAVPSEVKDTGHM